jgi:hypothetical protein
MPTLILSPRYDEDSIALWRAASTEGWNVVRTQGWRVDPDAARDGPVIYGNESDPGVLPSSNLWSVAT